MILNHSSIRIWISSKRQLDLYPKSKQTTFESRVGCREGDIETIGTLVTLKAELNRPAHSNRLQIADIWLKSLYQKNPSSRIWTSDLWMSDNVLLQSTALPTELSKVRWPKVSLQRSSFWFRLLSLSLKTCLLCCLPGTDLTISGQLAMEGA